MRRRSFLAGTAASTGMAALSLPILSVGRARYHGLHLARTDAARRAAIEDMVAANRPINFNVAGTYEIDRHIDLSRFTGRTIDLHPDCRIKSNGADAAANVFYSHGGTGIHIRGGILTPGSNVSALLHGHAIYFGNAADCWVEETVVEGAVRGAIIFNGATRCGWRDPVCRNSLQYSNPPADHTGLGYDFYLTGGIADFSGTGGLSYEGGGVGFAMQSVAAGNDTYSNISMTGWKVIRALAYGVMAYRITDTAAFKNIVLYGDLIDTIYGSVPQRTYGYVYGAGVYVQGVEAATAGAKIIRRTNLATVTDQLAPGAIGATNCTSGTLRAELIEDPNWYGVTVRDPNGEGNPGNPNAGLDAHSGGRMIVEVGVIRRPRKAAIEQRDLPVMQVRATVENPRAQALLVRNSSTNVGRSICERTILERFDVAGGAAANASSTGVAAINCSAGTLEYRSGSINGYHGLECIYHAGEGGLILGNIVLDASKCSLDAIRMAADQDAGVPIAIVTGAIRGTTLLVTELNAGNLRPGAVIDGGRVMPRTRILRLLTGAGGVGTYEVSPSQTIPNTIIVARRPPEGSRIAEGAKIICNANGTATNLGRPLRGLERVTYSGHGATPDTGRYGKGNTPR